MPELPDDFRGRVRAARAYKNRSREQFAAECNLDGMSASTLKGIENAGPLPPPLAREAFVRRVAEVSGLPESFLWGQRPPKADPESIEYLVDLLHETAQLAERVIRRQGDDIGRRGLQERRARDRRREALEAVRTGTP